MRATTTLFLFLLYTAVFCQSSVTATYSAGDIPTFPNNNTSNNVDDPTCNGVLATLDIMLPAGVEYEVTGIDVAYEMESLQNINISAQNSQIYCQNKSTSESAVYEGIGSTIGVYSYTRSAVDIANGSYPGGAILSFEMRASRDWS